MKRLIILLFIALISPIRGNSRLLFYLKPIPKQLINNLTEQDLHKKIANLKEKTPSQITISQLKRKMRKKRIQNNRGFLALYNGYIDYSSSDGQISFPLKQAEKKLYIAITPDIKPIKIKENTISHWEFIPKEKNNTKIYLFEKQIDSDKQYFWQVTEAKIPESNIVGTDYVVLLTKAKNIYVATGDFLSNDNKQLILPKNIYAIGDSQKNEVMLKFISLEKYFEPIEIESAKLNTMAFEEIIIND